MTDQNIQARYFDSKRNQYDVHVITNPPHHTELEMIEFFSAMGSVRVGAKIADFGAGTGRISIALAQKNIAVIAIDVSQKSLAELEALAQKHGLTGVSTRLEFQDGERFDAIVGADILHHVDLVEYTQVFAKHLGAGGKIVFSEPGGWHWFWYVYLPLFHDFEVEKGIVQLNIPFIHKALAKAGFAEIKIKSLGILPTPLHNFMPTWFAKMNVWLGNLPLLRYFGYRYIISAVMSEANE